ncbi:hypothetical protein BD560DRAFT_394214 [Blakeslea trispora]|nr:hypothetical protein BD560DRAFT_394214 [Blakeslea trispora]
MYSSHNPGFKKGHLSFNFVVFGFSVFLFIVEKIFVYSLFSVRLSQNFDLLSFYLLFYAVLSNISNIS